MLHRYKTIGPEGAPAREREPGAILFHAIPALEALHAPGRVNYPLLPREERVATAAHLHAQLRFCGPCFPRVAAGAVHVRLNVFWMGFRLHLFLYSLGRTLTFLRPSLLFGAHL